MNNENRNKATLFFKVPKQIYIGIKRPEKIYFPRYGYQTTTQIKGVKNSKITVNQMDRGKIWTHAEEANANMATTGTFFKSIATNKEFGYMDNFRKTVWKRRELIARLCFFSNKKEEKEYERLGREIGITAYLQTSRENMSPMEVAELKGHNQGLINTGQTIMAIDGMQKPPKGKKIIRVGVPVDLPVRSNIERER